MRKYIKKPINYEEVKWMNQEEKENPTLFQWWLAEAFRKVTNIDLFIPEG